MNNIGKRLSVLLVLYCSFALQLSAMETNAITYSKQINNNAPYIPSVDPFYYFEKPAERLDPLLQHYQQAPSSRVIDSIRTPFHQTLLMVACMLGYDEYVQPLIKAGANVNEKDKFENTALNWAASSGCNIPYKYEHCQKSYTNTDENHTHYLMCAQKILQRRALPLSARDANNKLLLTNLTQTTDGKDSMSPLHSACATSNFKMLRFLLDEAHRLEILDKVFRQKGYHKRNLFHFLIRFCEGAPKKENPQTNLEDTIIIIQELNEKYPILSNELKGEIDIFKHTPSYYADKYINNRALVQLIAPI